MASKRRMISNVFVFEGKSELNYFNSCFVKLISPRGISICCEKSKYFNFSEVDNLLSHLKGKFNCKCPIWNNRRYVYWFVDADKIRKDTYAQSIKKLKEHRIIPIFSNPCFEVRLLSHFQNVTNVHKSTVYEKAIEKHIKAPYAKGMFDIKQASLWYKNAVRNNLIYQDIIYPPLSFFDKPFSQFWYIWSRIIASSTNISSTFRMHSIPS